MQREVEYYPTLVLVTLDFPALNRMTMINNGVCTSALTAMALTTIYIVELLLNTVCISFSCALAQMCIPCKQVLILLLLKEKIT